MLPYTSDYGCTATRGHLHPTRACPYMCHINRSEISRPDKYCDSDRQILRLRHAESFVVDFTSKQRIATMTSCCSVSALYVSAATSMRRLPLQYSTLLQQCTLPYVEGVLQGAWSAAIAVLRKRLAVHRTLLAPSVPPGLARFSSFPQPLRTCQISCLLNQTYHT